MADSEVLLRKLQELKDLPTEQHLFCPRLGGEDGQLYYDEDIAGIDEEADDTSEQWRKEKIVEAETRKWLTLDCLMVLAFDDDAAAPFRSWVTDRLNTQLTSCDVCIRIFHHSRAEWYSRLAEEFDEENVLNFLKTIDNLCIDRIRTGLDMATEILEKAEPRQRTLKLIPAESTYAFFESLSCKAFFENEELLYRHFDTPFDLVQTRKRLKLQNFLPAMTRFLFGQNESRRRWAHESFVSFQRHLLRTEFDWAVRDYLLKAMQRVQITSLEVEFVTQFWSGVKMIIEKLDKELITHCLRGLDLDLYKLMLDHFQLDNKGFFDIIDTMKRLLEKSPADFWDAMGAISPATVVEQVFNSPVLKRLLLQAIEKEGQSDALTESLAWMTPFLTSIKPANMTPACRALAHQLLGRLQSDQYSRVSRAYCFKEGLRVLDYAFRRLGTGTTNSTFVGQPVVDAMLDVLEPHIQLIVTTMKRYNGVKASEEYELGLSMIENAFKLECLSLRVERECITVNDPSPTGPTASRPVWKAIIGSIDIENVGLAIRLLVAGKNLIGLEPLFMKPNSTVKISPAVKHFNQRFELLSQSITEVIERLNGFDPEQLDGVFDKPDAATGIIATLFSSDKAARQATVEVLKVISGQDTRRDAIRHILVSYYQNSIRGFVESCRQVMRKTIFSPVPSMIKMFSDVIDVMCNSQDGTLRSGPLNAEEAELTRSLWRALWFTLTTIFKTTEGWSNMGYDKNLMMDFCRDTMQFADQLFDECSIFATALKESLDPEDTKGRKDLMKDLLSHPAQTMDGISKWLRLRDEFLSTKSVTLITKLLTRLHEVDVEVDGQVLLYIERVLEGDIRTKISMQQQAVLQRALETYIGRSLVKEEEHPVKVEKQASLNKWMHTGGSFGQVDPQQKKTIEAMKARQLAERTKRNEAAEKLAASKLAQMSEFKRKRQLEQEAKRKRDAAIVAESKKNAALRGWSEHTAEVGSGLEGLGVLGKDTAAKGEGAFLSSDESEDDEFDRELFGISKEKKPKAGPKTNIVNGLDVRMPVKKRRIVRSAKDMRARIKPDLTPLHKTILSWNYYHDGDFPPNTRREIYSKVPNVFRTPNDYQTTFEPLLTLEAWQGFVKAREENTFKPYEIKVVSRASVDQFQEVGSTMTHADNKDLSLSEGDIVLLSKSKNSTADDPHCLAHVFRITRKKDHLEVAYRVIPGNPLQSSLVPKGTVFGAKIQSITPLEREYASLLGLQYYDLCDEICHAKPSPLLDYSDKQLGPLITNYNVNKAQAKAIKSAIDNDAFTLIQGPPGSGKTKTIVAIIGAILSNSQRPQGTTINVPGQPKGPEEVPKKLLVCAPSNAAVDELVMRFKEGIKTLKGEHRKINIVRIGRGDAININVKDVTLEELVNKRLGVSSNGNDSDATRKLFAEHQEVSKQLREVREQLDAGPAQGEESDKLKKDFDALRRRKTDLGTRIDNVKDEEKMASRTADLNRKRAQAAVLASADVICATLSGSGHEMFSNTSIEFETVVVDEAAQCVEMSALIPLKYGAAKCILVGDPKQLPPTVFSKEAARFQYEQSLFVRMQANHPNDVHLLDTQYRMHPEISLFPSRTFYDGKLLDGDDMAGLRQRPWHNSLLLGPYRFFDVQGQHQAAPKGHSLINLAEIEIAMQLYNRLINDFRDYNFSGKVGIITPYKSQLRELRVRFAQRYGESILETVEFNTTDAFQGRESEIIIFSCVRASPAGGIGFLQDIRRMNVGLTRAKSSLWVLGNSQSLIRGQFWRQLVEDAQQRDRYSQGDLMAMLRKHSSAFPAPKGQFVVNRPIKQEPAQIKQEPESAEMDRSNDQSGDFRHLSISGTVKVKKEDPDVDMGGVGTTSKSNGKRKMDFSSDGEDVDMKDETTSSGTNSKSNTNTARSTPAVMSDDARGGSASEVNPKLENTAPQGTQAPQAPQPLQPPAVGPGGMAMNRPKIRRARPKEVDPFIRRPQAKKPRQG
ncbi:DNA-binding protein SMUBP-2 [Delitschia confertaspora ATCC 74209]|uniref:DNA-binding protein SMUBP-2 n=1 Tax=Delitschia confertaspora ATCC 74209 TaxID=1513339 RepID=A0A9P4JT47_9PLEO|nr:DNA-binding protein SMUBP-2 [Delitschia confertaspora ATCC 74209]